MTLPEWTTRMIDEVRASGFEAREHMGFPLVTTPADLAGKFRLLELKLSMSHEKRVYADGVLLVPIV